MSLNTACPPNRRTAFHSIQTLQASQRRAECVNLRLEGKTLREIGKQLGLSVSTVQGHIRAALAFSQAVAARAAVSLRAKEHARLEALLAHWTPQAMGDTGSWGAARAAKIVLKAQEDLAALYAPPAGSQMPASPVEEASPAIPAVDPEEDAFLDRVAADALVTGAMSGLLPRTGYDAAWDALEEWRGAGGGWQPAAYQPDDQMQNYLRANWHVWFPKAE